MRLVSHTGPDLQAVSVREHHTLRDAISLMSVKGLRLVPVLTAEGGFAGVIGDGDLRRHLATGGDLEDPVGQATNRTPITIDHEMSPPDLRQFMDWKGVEYLPQIEQGRLTALHVLWLGAPKQSMTAVIMAGGLGTRLAPLTDGCPKPLLPIAGKPIMTHIIEHLRSQGVTRFVISVNHLAEMIVNHYGDGSSLGVSISYQRETMRMGTGGALGLVDPETLSDPFLCLNGDILNDVDVRALRSKHEKHGWDATMVLWEHSLQVPYGVVRATETGAFDKAEEKPTLRFTINAGFYLLSKSALAAVPKGIFYDLPTLFTDLRPRNLVGGTYLHSGRWIDIGNVTEFDRARKIYEEAPRQTETVRV